MAAPIELVTKAANVCLSCRLRKQRCDRLLPHCSRCAIAGKQCDYAPISKLCYSPQEAKQPIISDTNGLCGPELTLRGQSELLRASSTLDDSGLGFVDLVAMVIGACHFEPYSLLAEYDRQTHTWLPVLDDDQRLGKTLSPSRWATRSSALLRLAMMLLVRKQCGHAVHLRSSPLYQTIKQLLATLPTVEKPCIEHLQTSLLLALYECGHGMTEAAYLTLSSSAAFVNLISEQQAGRCPLISPIDQEKYWTIVLILDRVICLSSLDGKMSLVSPARDGIARDLIRWRDPERGVRSMDVTSLSITGQAAAVAGYSLEDARFYRWGRDPHDDDYSSDAELADLVRALVNREDTDVSHACDALSLSLCCLLILCQARAQQHEGFNSSKATMALKYYRRMAWEICKVAIDEMQPFDVSRMSFIAMCSIVRSVVIITETRENDIPKSEIERLLPVLVSFSKQWAVGVAYLDVIESSLRKQESPAYTP